MIPITRNDHSERQVLVLKDLFFVEHFYLSQNQRKLFLATLILATLFVMNLPLSAQKIWEDDGITITKLDTLEGYEALRGTFTIKNSSIHEVMNRILDVDNYDWVEGESTSKMLLVEEDKSSFTFDFFVDIPWLFIKKTGRARVDVHPTSDGFSAVSKQIKDYKSDERYDVVDFYFAEWGLQKSGEKDVKVTYLGVYQDQKMLLNINSIIINKIRKRLNGTFQNLREIASNKVQPANVLSWPKTF